ncbi:MAG: glycosyltransferase [Megasphaera elsdenii]|nr:glycosyltransferase [Megasphaera elsdenii]
MPTKISVIIPVYNTEKYIGDCLNSLYKQSLKEIEIICVNDGSTDMSLDILKKYAKIDHRLKIISLKNQGVSVARNTGIAIATGEYIQFIDSDDMLVPESLSYAFQQMVKKQLDVFYFDARAIFESAQLEAEKSSYKTYYHRENRYQDVQTGCQLFTKLMKDGAFRPNGNLQMIRRDFLLQSGVKYIPGIVQEDNAFTAELMLHASRVCHINKPLYIRRVRPDSIMTKPQAFYNAYGYFRCAMAMEKYFFKLNIPEDTRSVLQVFCQSLLRNMQTIYKNIPEEEREKIRTIATEERGAMLYFCWYSEQASKSKYEVNKKSAEFKALKNEKEALIRQNEEIQSKNTACQQQIKEQDNIIQKLNETFQHEKRIFTRNYQDIYADKQKLQNQFLCLEKQAEESQQKNIVYQQQMAERNKAFHILQTDFLAMQQSLSFRLGRKLTWLPRMIRDRFLRWDDKS